MGTMLLPALEIAMKLVGPCLGIAPLLCLHLHAHAGEFQDPNVIQAGGGISVVARRATVTVPGLGTVSNAYTYDVGSELGPGSRPDQAVQAGLMPPIIAASRGKTLRVTLRNDLKVRDAAGIEEPSSSNLHVHGLIVSPQGIGLHEASAKRLYGDCVFVSATTQRPGDPGTPAAGDPCSEKADRPNMTQEAGEVAYSYPVAPDHPSGLFWMHPHRHGQSEPQISNGLGALLTIGSIWDYSFLGCRVSVSLPVASGVCPTASGIACQQNTQLGAVQTNEVCRTQEEQKAELDREAAADAADGAVHVRYLALKDIQVKARTASDFDLIEFPKRPEGEDGTTEQFKAANDARKSICGDLFLGRSLRDDLVYVPDPHDRGAGFGHGECWSKDDDSSRWVFTVSGQVYPNITIAPGSVEVWRVANTSADVTYRVRLETIETPPRRLSFKARALDGVATSSDETLDQFVLMPSARIEILVERCKAGVASTARSNCVDPGRRVVARLRTGGVATGITTRSVADPSARADGDQWPPIDLATVTFERAPSATELATPDLKSVPVQMALLARSAPPLDGSKTDLPSVSADAAAPAVAGSAASPSRCDWSSYRTGPADFDEASDLVRLIRFNNRDFGDNAGELFGIHAENRHLADMRRHEVTVAMLMRDGQRRPVGAHALIADVSLADACHDGGGLDFGTFGRFYPKFSMDGPATIVARYGATEYWLVVNDSRECHNFHIHQMKFTVVDADVKVDSDGDRISSDQCLGDRHLVPPIAQDRLHDNYPLPPGARVLFRMTFDGPKLGRFVFHCHILEHEDKGMMATIDVVDAPGAAKHGLLFEYLRHALSGAHSWSQALVDVKAWSSSGERDRSAVVNGPICRAKSQSRNDRYGAVSTAVAARSPAP